MQEGQSHNNMNCDAHFSDGDTLLWPIIIKTLGYSIGYALALLAGLLHGDSSALILHKEPNMVYFILSLWASSLPFFYFYCLKFNAGEGGFLGDVKRKNHLTISIMISALFTVLFLVLARYPFPLCIMPIISFAAYLIFAVILSKRDISQEKPVRFQLIVPVLAATALPFCLGD